MLRRRLTACNQHRPHTRTLRHIRPLLTLEAAQAVAVSIVEGGRLDYCNKLLYGTTERNFDRLQRVQKLWHVLPSELRGQPVHLVSYGNYTGCR